MNKTREHIKVAKDIDIINDILIECGKNILCHDIIIRYAGEELRISPVMVEPYLLCPPVYDDPFIHKNELQKGSDKDFSVYLHPKGGKSDFDSSVIDPKKREKRCGVDLVVGKYDESMYFSYLIKICIDSNNNVCLQNNTAGLLFTKFNLESSINFENKKAEVELVRNNNRAEDMMTCPRVLQKAAKGKNRHGRDMKEVDMYRGYEIACYNPKAINGYIFDNDDIYSSYGKLRNRLSKKN